MPFKEWSQQFGSAKTKGILQGIWMMFVGIIVVIGGLGIFRAGCVQVIESIELEDGTEFLDETGDKLEIFEDE